jgi:hypothetical protein
MRIENDMPDKEFVYIDDELYSIIQKTLAIKYSINEDKELFEWYCKIRDKLCKDIHNKKIKLNLIKNKGE